jgi:Arc/MetJ-type ribon-helix-helix transcriptional regulator
MKTISVNIPEAYLEAIEELVVKGLYANRSEFIRESVSDHYKRTRTLLLAIQKNKTDLQFLQTRFQRLKKTVNPEIHPLIDEISQQVLEALV